MERKRTLLLQLRFRLQLASSELGSDNPLSICAGRLFKAVTRGVATVFASPLDSAIEIRALI